MNQMLKHFILAVLNSGGTVEISGESLKIVKPSSTPRDCDTV